MIIDNFIKDILEKTLEELQLFFSGLNEDTYGKPGIDRLMLIKKIKRVVKNYTSNEDILLYIPTEIENLTNTLIDSMFFTAIHSKLYNKDKVNFILRTIEGYIANSDLIFNELQKEASFNNGPIFI
tara:strand:+ start:731 stop:1108 length:378 start_codon:yes stop_codon:yes gene_type:complete